MHSTAISLRKPRNRIFNIGMYRNFKVYAFAAAFLAFAICCLHAQSWSSGAAGKALNLKILEPKDFHTNQPSPMIIYLENLAVPRVGTDSDDTIIHDFLNDGYLVVVLDYNHDLKARLPFINNDIFEMRKEVLHKQFISGYEIDLAHVFIIPSGCRLLPDVTFYQDPGRTLAMDIVYPSHPAQPV